MKSLRQYINEEYQNFTISEVEVKYDIYDKKTKEPNIVFEVPENYLEDNIQIYLEDYLIPESFIGRNFVKKYFGYNSEKIFDSFFEYTGIDDVEKPESYIEFNTRYDERNSKDVKLRYVKFKDFKFIVKFENFIIKDKDNNNFQEILEQIFQRPLTDREWILNFKLDNKNIKYQN